MMRPHYFLVAALLFGGLLRAEPDKKTPPKKDDGISVQIHDGKVEVDGVQDMIQERLDDAFDSIDLDDVPAPVREKLKERLGKLRGKIGARLKNLNAKDLDQLGKELDKMGEDIGKEMEGLGSDMDKWSKDFGKQFGEKFAKKFPKGGFKLHIGHDDDDDDVPGVPDIDDADDLADAVKDMGDLKLQQPQKDQLTKLRADSDKQVAAAKQALETASKTLHDQLENGKASDADIAKSIDAVTQQEAAIRKARILAWVNARRVLDDAQRKKVEGAAAKAKTK
jgi:hypothetical protein